MFVSTMTVLILLFASSMAAYVLARFEFRGNQALYSCLSALNAPGSFGRGTAVYHDA